ncbi:MAG TPA: hypothetical protein VFP33_06305 [Gallionella sp.]|nr:hypothetical protein [Gallionella sp.]
MSRSDLLLAVLLSGSSLVMVGAVDFSPGLLRFVSSRWGADATGRLQDWRDAELDRIRIRQNKFPAPADLRMGDLKAINSMWNKVPT